LKFSLEGYDERQKVDSKKAQLKAYKEALKAAQRLAVNANKFKNSPFLLLFSIKERDESEQVIRLA